MNIRCADIQLIVLRTCQQLLWKNFTDVSILKISYKAMSNIFQYIVT